MAIWELLIIIFVVIVFMAIVPITLFIINKFSKNSSIIKKVRNLANKTLDSAISKVEEKKEDDFVVCKYCGVKNKKDATKCESCNARL